MGDVTWSSYGLEVTRELRLSASADGPEGEDDREDWRQRACQWLQKGHAKGRKRLHRVASRDLMCALDAQLRQMTGEGLASYVPTTASYAAGGPWPTLTLCCDQASDNQCVNWYLQGKVRASVVCIWDPNHRCWNDVRLSLVNSGLWLLLLLLLVPLNLTSGPWGTGAFGAQLIEATRALGRVAGPDDALFCRLLPAIARERNEWDDYLSDPGYARRIWRLVETEAVWSGAGRKVSMVRWYEAVKAARAFHPWWHLRLLVLLYAGLEQGWYSEARQKRITQRMPAAAPSGGEDFPKQSVPSGHSDVADLRRRCVNSMHLACQVLLDSDRQRALAGIVALGSRVEEAFGKHNSRNRSSEGSLAYCVAEARGDGVSILNSSVRLLTDQTVLWEIGLAGCAANKAAGLDLQAEHMASDELAGKLGLFMLEIVAHRWRSLSSWWFTPPHRLAVLGSDIVADRTGVLQELRVADEAWQAARALEGDAFWRKACTRSCFTWAATEMFVSMARKAGWEPSDELVHTARSVFSGFSQSKAAEDMIGAARHHETHDAKNMVMSVAAIYASTIKHRILSNTHSYSEPRWQEDARSACEVQRGMFHASEKECSLGSERVRGISGLAPKPTWPSFTAATALCVQAEYILMLRCHRENLWGQCKTAWLALLFSCKLLVRRVGAEDWLVTVGHMHGVVGLAWPVEVVQREASTQRQYWRLRDDVTRRTLEGAMMMVTDLSEWHAYPYTWSSSCSSKRMADSEGIYICTVGKPEPLVRSAARQCFGDLPLVPLVNLCSHFAVDCEDTGDLFSVLRDLCVSVLGLPDESPELLEILSKRLKSPDDVTEFFEHPEVETLFDDKDKEFCTKAHSEVVADRDYRDRYVKRFDEWRVSKHLPARAGAGGRKSGGARTARGRKHAAWPQGDFSTEVAKSMLPEARCGLFKDPFNGRWRAWYVGWGSKSRSWGDGTGRAAACYVLRWVWRCHTLTTGEACPWQELADEASW